MSASVSFDLETRDDVVVATFAGELDRADVERVREQILGALSTSARGLVCDLSGLSYLDSAGVHLLHRLARALQASGQQIVAVYPRTATPRRVLDITGIAEAVPMYASLEEAIAASAIGVIGLAE